MKQVLNSIHAIGEYWNFQKISVMPIFFFFGFVLSFCTHFKNIAAELANPYN